MLWWNLWVSLVAVEQDGHLDMLCLGSRLTVTIQGLAGSFLAIARITPFDLRCVNK